MSCVAHYLPPLLIDALLKLFRKDSYGQDTQPSHFFWYLQAPHLRRTASPQSSLLGSAAGTSPLYLWPSVFSSEPTAEDVVGATSLVLWTLTLMVVVKYVVSTDTPIGEESDTENKCMVAQGCVGLSRLEGGALYAQKPDAAVKHPIRDAESSLYWST